jgi:hypothetical protein
VIVDQPWNNCSTLKVDQLRRGPLEFFNIGIATYCNDTLAFNRQRLHCGEPIVDGNNFSVCKNQISRLSEGCSGPNHCKTENDRAND